MGWSFKADRLDHLETLLAQFGHGAAQALDGLGPVGRPVVPRTAHRYRPLAVGLREASSIVAMAVAAAKCAVANSTCRGSRGWLSKFSRYPSPMATCSRATSSHVLASMLISAGSGGVGVCSVMSTSL